MRVAVTKYDEFTDDDVATMERAKIDGVFVLNDLKVPADVFVIRQIYTQLDHVDRYVESCAEIIEASPDCTHFVLHDASNESGRGWGWAWLTPQEFSGWWRACAIKIKDNYPDIKIGYPRLKKGMDIGVLRGSHHDFLRDSRPALEVSDFVGMDVTWQCGEGNLMQMYDNIYYVAYTKHVTGLPVMVTYHNSNNNVAKRQKAGQYLTFLKELSDNNLAFFAACHTLSSDLRSDLWSVWRTTRGESPIPRIIGRRDF